MGADPVSMGLALGGSLLQGAIGSNAARRAAEAQRMAAYRAQIAAQNAYGTGLAVQNPFMQAGTGAWNQLASIYGLPTQAAPNPSDLLAAQSGQMFKLKDVTKMLKSGMSVEQIARMGTLKPIGGKDIANLGKKYGVDAAGVKALQMGPSQYLFQPKQPTGQETPGSAQAGPNYSAFFQSPDYTFRRDEGMRGLERAAAARGGAFSGNALRALIGYNSALASNEYGNYFNRQMQMTGVGQGAANNVTQLGSNYGSAAANAATAAGNARASGVLGSAGSWMDAIGGAGSAIGRYLQPQWQTPGFNPLGG